MSIIRKPRENPRTERVYIRLSVAEASGLAERAEASDMTVSDYMRTAALGVEIPRARARARIAIMSGDAARIVRQLSAIGSNINQLARAANSGGDVGTATLTEALTDLRSVLLALRDA